MRVVIVVLAVGVVGCAAKAPSVRAQFATIEPVSKFASHADVIRGDIRSPGKITFAVANPNRFSMTLIGGDWTIAIDDSPEAATGRLSFDRHLPSRSKAKVIARLELNALDALAIGDKARRTTSYTVRGVLRFRSGVGVVEVPYRWRGRTIALAELASQALWF